jgi:hypothetical protein
VNFVALHSSTKRYTSAVPRRRESTLYAVFDQLTQKMAGIAEGLFGKKKITEKNIEVGYGLEAYAQY